LLDPALLWPPELDSAPPTLAVWFPSEVPHADASSPTAMAVHGRLKALFDFIICGLSSTM
jgi:hypothetical protein